jgi:hypothetical protein
MNACEFCGSNTKMCIVSDKLYRFCCQEARSRPPVTLLNLPPCINESDTEDEDNDSDTQSADNDDSDTQSVDSESDDDL